MVDRVVEWFLFHYDTAAAYLLFGVMFTIGARALDYLADKVLKKD